MPLIQDYLRSLYERTMTLAYEDAYASIARAGVRGRVLDCGANDGSTFSTVAPRCALTPDRYAGIEWDRASVQAAQARGLAVVHGDLNQALPHGDASFDCVYALSVLEHLLNPCRFLGQAHRVLKPGGRLVLLTPNISTWFTALQILVGRMPSSGPHPDSDALLKSQEMFKVSSEALQPDAESAAPVHRHLVVFSFRVLRQYLGMLGFTDVRGRGYGYYPLPAFAQPLFERLDPYHCHQMVFTATR